MSHHAPYYAQAPLGQSPAPPPAAAMVEQQQAAMTTGSTVASVWRVAGTVASAALAWHGYRRNHGSIGWAIAWAVVGGFAWPIALSIAVASGFGQPAPVTRNRRRRSRR